MTNSAVTNTSYGGNWCTTNWCTTNWCGYYNICQIPTQVTFLTNGVKNTSFQMNWVFYNLTNLRILWELASDGITTNNFTASSQVSNDKAIVNVKNDIIEKYWQSTSNSNEYIQFDAGANKAIYIDTLGIIQHNFTTSVTLNLKGYGTGTDIAPASWGTVPVYATISAGTNPNDPRILWCSSTNPTSKYRHWRLEISDSTNTDAFLRIGRFVAGQALILNGENLMDSLKFSKQNFKEEIALNGFSSVFNNRTLKRKLDITLANLNVQTKSNYNLISKYVDYSRDVYKSLIIPDPHNPYKYSIYAKLTGLPAEDISYVDSNNEYSTYTLSYDEAK